MVDFDHNKTACWNLDVCCQSLQIFYFTSQILQSFIPSQWATRIIWKAWVKAWLVDLPFQIARKVVADGTLIRILINWDKINVGIDAPQLHPFSMCQAMPAGLYTRWELDSESGQFKQRQNKTRSFENMVTSYFQRVRTQCKCESLHDRYTEKNWCIQCWRLLGTLQQCVWSGGALYSKIPMSRSSSFSLWGRKSARL